MRESTNFSKEEKEKTNLDFFELRQIGLDYIQKLSGENWTDFNSHDPGVTILEQLCYALTDVSLRTSLDIKDLLTHKVKDESNENKEIKKVNATKHAFFPPSEIYRNHPVTILDLRKAIIDNFVDVHNVWIKTTDNSGLEEKLVLIERVDVLLKSLINRGSDVEEKAKNDIIRFISEHRNLGEDVEKICFLKPKYVALSLEIHLMSAKEIEETLTNCLMALFEYVYTPVSQHTREEMLRDGYKRTDLLSGPKMKNGYIKDSSLEERRVNISKEELKNIISLVENIYKCAVTSLAFKAETGDTNESGVDEDELSIGEAEFFHLFDEAHSNQFTLESFEPLFKAIEVKVNEERLNLSYYNRSNIHDLFYENWTKKYGPYAIRDVQNYDFNKNLKGNSYSLDKYYSVQNHFPQVYGIGKDGLSSYASSERRAQAKQLKGYLLFFEQYLANHLSQLSHLDDFFDITEPGERTYFTQQLNNKNVPNIEPIHSEFKSKRWTENFFDRKDRTYSHLLARFGEDLNPIIWKQAFDSEKNGMESIKSAKEIKQDFLKQKSNFLLKIPNINAERSKGEVFVVKKDNGTDSDNECDCNFIGDSNCGNKRIKSGLEEIILAKTALTRRNCRNSDQRKNTNEEAFYIVDHILLRDFINDSDHENKVKYGFKIVDAEDNLICTTIDEHFCKTKEDRIEHFDALLLTLQEDGIYEIKDDITARLKTNTLKDLATFTEDPKEPNKTRTRIELKELVDLFNVKQSSNGRARLQEVEKIRAKGVHEVTRGKYGQKRLIFQRTLNDFLQEGKSVTIDEDFFNLSISIVLPKWPRKFQNLQFKSYLEDLIIERVPSHIRVNLLWINEEQMNDFTKVYHDWENRKASSPNGSMTLKEASYRVYKEIQKLKIELAKPEENKSKLEKN